MIAAAGTAGWLGRRVGRHRFRRARQRVVARPAQSGRPLASGRCIWLRAGVDGRRSGYVDPGFRWTPHGVVCCRRTPGSPTSTTSRPACILDLAQRGAGLAKEHCSAHGPPVSLLDQEVLEVSAAGHSVGIPMRCVFALTAMGFLPQKPAPRSSRPSRSARTRWSGCGRRRPGCGSTPASARVYRRRGDPAVVLR